MTSEHAKLLQRDAEWSALASEGRDVEAILSFWTDDAIVFAPGLAPVVGKRSLREYVQSSLSIPGFKITWRSTDLHLSADESLAYMLGTNEVTLNGPDDVPVKIEGRAVTIWRREADGEWRCAIDIWNS